MRDLRDREDEDEVVEELERADAALVGLVVLDVRQADGQVLLAAGVHGGRRGSHIASVHFPKTVAQSQGDRHLFGLDFLVRIHHTDLERHDGHALVLAPAAELERPTRQGVLLFRRPFRDVGEGIRFSRPAGRRNRPRRK